MMIKRSWLQGEPTGDPLVRVVHPGRMEKTASATMPEVQAFISKLVPDPRCTYVHVNAMGYSEFFGANANKDYYGHNHHLDFNGLLNAPPEWGIDPAKDMAAGKKWAYGFPTYYGATVYAHHKNSCRDTLGFGDVVFVMPNHKMKRIELVMRVDNALIHERGRSSILDRIRQQARVDVSMGCRVPFDLCSICTDWDTIQTAWSTFDPGRHAHPGIAILQYHRGVTRIRGLSITRADYCEHMRRTPGAILPNGQKVYVYNDFPRFFDISFVWIGADRTARVMWSMGGNNPLAKTTTITIKTSSPIQMINERRATVLGAMEKQAGGELFFKRGEIEKEISATYARKIDLCAKQEPDLPLDILNGASESFGPHTVLSTLAALGIVLKPREFHIVVTKGQPMSEKIAGLAMAKNAEFDTSTSDVDDKFAVSGDKVNPELARVFQPAAASRSSFAPHLSGRVGSSSGSSILKKESSVLTSELMNKLAAQYNGYRLSVLEQAPEIFPKYAGLGSVALTGGMKFLNLATKGVTAAGAAPLLLGLGPMIHLVSAHLRKKQEAGGDLGTVAKFIAENPTFTSLATIGAGLRAAMAIQGAGGLGTALKGVASALRAVV